jgi:hypothetical protein
VGQGHDPGRARGRGPAPGEDQRGLADAGVAAQEHREAIASPQERVQARGLALAADQGRRATAHAVRQRRRQLVEGRAGPATGLGRQAGRGRRLGGREAHRHRQRRHGQLEGRQQAPPVVAVELGGRRQPGQLPRCHLRQLVLAVDEERRAQRRHQRQAIATVAVGDEHARHLDRARRARAGRRPGIEGDLEGGGLDAGGQEVARDRGGRLGGQVMREEDPDLLAGAVVVAERAQLGGDDRRAGRRAGRDHPLDRPGGHDRLALAHRPPRRHSIEVMLPARAVALARREGRSRAEERPETEADRGRDRDRDRGDRGRDRDRDETEAEAEAEGETEAETEGATARRRAADRRWRGPRPGTPARSARRPCGRPR